MLVESSGHLSRIAAPDGNYHRGLYVRSMSCCILIVLMVTVQKPLGYPTDKNDIPF